MTYGILLALLSIICGAAQAADLQQFDLQCEGTKTNPILKTSEPWLLRYRVDLAMSSFCVGSKERCEGPFPIVSVRPGEIVFQDSKDAYSWFEARVDRMSGAFIQRVGFFLPEMARYSYEVSAICVREPFSGLPETKF